MSNDQTFFHSLADFRDVKMGALHDQSKLRESSVCGNSNSLPQLDTQCNDKLLKNFKQLREQLKEACQVNQKLRGKLVEKENQIDGVKVSEKEKISLNYELKKQVERRKEESSELKEKVKYLKEKAKDANKSSEEVQYLKISVCELRKKVEEVEEEKRKILEMSVMEKVEMEEKVKMLEVKESSEAGYVQDMEIQMTKLRDKCIRLENQLKKSQIKYDEELYNKKWMNGNFEREHLEQQIQQAERDKEDFESKLKKEKERRNGLERRVLELEELSGLWTVKAETFEVENKTLSRKFKKMEKKINQLKESADKKITESLTLEQKFLKSVALAEDLISRVKRELIGDVVVLAKTCEYKLNKLKEEKDTFCTKEKDTFCMKEKDTFCMKEKEVISRKSPAMRGRSKSKPKISPTRKLLAEEPEKPKFEFTKSQLPTDRLKEMGILGGDVGRERQSKCSEETSQCSSSKGPLTQIDNIEVKIRREREEMEKKIREKMLYRQIEVASSPEKHRLREDYFRLIEK